jgi:hypothetical protein
MARTTSEQVAAVIEVDATINLTPFIEMANQLVTEACTGVNGPSTPYAESRLELIERWLAAHFYTVRDPRAVTEKAGAVSATVQSAVDLGFDTSHYGQSAMRIDTNGGLARINNKAKRGVGKPGMVWLGTPRK